MWLLVLGSCEGGEGEDVGEIDTRSIVLFDPEVEEEFEFEAELENES